MFFLKATHSSIDELLGFFFVFELPYLSYSVTNDVCAESFQYTEFILFMYRI